MDADPGVTSWLCVDDIADDRRRSSPDDNTVAAIFAQHRTDVIGAAAGTDHVPDSVVRDDDVVVLPLGGDANAGLPTHNRVSDRAEIVSMGPDRRRAPRRGRRSQLVRVRDKGSLERTTVR